MKLFNDKELSFLEKVDGSPSSYGKEDRQKALDTALKELEAIGYTPKIGKKQKENWVSTGDSGHFHDLCFAGMGTMEVDALARKVNPSLKNVHAKFTPDNYGTMFLSMEDTQYIQESYIGNFFYNKLLLWKFASKPEMNRKFVQHMMDALNKSYAQIVKTKEAKEVMKKKDVGDYYFPVYSIKHSDGLEIVFYLNFDATSFTPGAAVRSTKGVNMVVLYPGFFQLDNEGQIFCLLHEIGHVRLGHIQARNQYHSWLTPSGDRRQDAMRKGKVVYTELNADLYALLNGAKLYAILGMLDPRDHDEKYDYRWSNEEISNRYHKGFRSYIKLRGTALRESYSEDFEDLLNEEISYALESGESSHIVMEELYPKVEEVLRTKEGDKYFKNAVENFIDRNAQKLHEPCPITLIPFADADKKRFFDLFNVEEKAIKEIVSRAVKSVSDTANFVLMKQNPIFTLFYCVVRYYTLIDDKVGINAGLIIHALASYPSVFSKYFKYGANEGVMRYTADHLTEKFIFKQEGHVFGALRASIYSAYSTLSPFMKDGSDKEIVRYVQRIRNDQNSLLKKINNEYKKNYAAGRSVSTQVETYDTGELIDDLTNDTSKVETTSQRILINLLTGGINLRTLQSAAAIAQISATELRMYLTKILIDGRSDELERFITAVLFVYLYEERHKVEEIKSKVFLSFAIELFRKTNSNNPNIATIKALLDLWAEQIGIHSKFHREATRIIYKKGIFWYLILSIQALV